MMDSLGQLYITGIEGTSLKEEERIFLEKENIGGVILFARNYESPTQLAELVNSIQVLRKDYPLFISVDHEGGRVLRFRTHFTQFPAMGHIASSDSPKVCYEVHKIMAEELSICGINLSYSPVCDVLTNPLNQVIGDRAFGKDPEVVEKFISSAIRGLQTNGILACAKHFPGHGCTTEDSHFDLPVVKKELDDFRKLEFIPFIKASKSRVEFLMVAHLLVESLDKELPCSLVAKTYQIIRDELKFSKIIITDDLEMKAITDRFKIEEAALMSLAAGSDMVLFRNMETAQKSLQLLKEAVKTKKLKKKDVIDKIDRVIECKKKYFSEYQPIYIPAVAEKFNTKSNQNYLNHLHQTLRASP